MNDHHPIDHMDKQQRDKHLAHLLGLSYEEFIRLHHSGLKEVTDSELQVYKYYIQFNRDNPADILAKLDMDAQYTVYFSAAEWEEEKENGTK